MKLYRALHTTSKEKGDPCYMTRHGGIITRDKAKAKTWKTRIGIEKFLSDPTVVGAGYEVEEYEV